MAGNDSSLSLSQVGTVFIPVADQDRALKFYVEKLGFEKRAEFQYGEGCRWIEVAPSSSTISIALVPPSEGKSSGGGETHCAIASKNIEADHAALLARGVDVDAEIARKGKRRTGLISVEVSIADPVPPQFFFRDADGNRFLVVETN